MQNKVDTRFEADIALLARMIAKSKRYDPICFRPYPLPCRKDNSFYLDF